VSSGPSLLVVKFILVSLLPNVLEGKVAVYSILEIAPGIELALKADQFGIFFALIASGYGYLLHSIPSDI
jgi:multicomponent Na+:H+ antiporter subunit D